MKIIYRIFLLLIVCFAVNKNVSAAGQNDSIVSVPKGAIITGINLYGGYVMTAYERVSNLSAHTWGTELVLSQKTCGTQAWHCVYGMPRVGVSLFYMDLGKPDITGKIFAVLPHFQFPLHRTKRSELGLRIATGVGYFTKVFDAESNFKNKAISTSFNAAMQPTLLFSHTLTEKLEINAGIGLTHFSNGSYSLPNNGINIPNSFIGLMYSFQKENDPSALILKPAPVKKKKYYYSYFAAATKQAGNFGEKRFAAFTLGSGFGWQVSQKSKLGAGIDFFYDRSLPSLSGNDNLLLPDGQLDYGLKNVFQSAVKLEHELVIGKLGVIGNACMYLYDPAKAKNGLFYQRIGLKYNFLPNAFGGIFLKTHFASADFIEWAIGFNI